jgi:hypothetical protein
VVPTASADGGGLGRPPVASIEDVTPIKRPVLPAPLPRARSRWPYFAAAIAVVVAGILGVDAWISDKRRTSASPPEAAASMPAPTAAPAATEVSSAGLAPAPTPPASAGTRPPVPAAATDAGAPFDAGAARLMLRRASAVKDWARATAAFFALAEHDPDSFHDPALVVAARDMAAVAGAADGEETDRIFDTLAQRLGSGGPDILYEIVRTRGGSKSATRAHDLLRNEDVLARATAELRITIALRDAACPDKTALLDRAVTEGDGRTLLVMQTVGAACLGRNQALYDAQRALRIRLQAAAPKP